MAISLKAKNVQGMCPGGINCCGIPEGMPAKGNKALKAARRRIRRGGRMDIRNEREW